MNNRIMTTGTLAVIHIVCQNAGQPVTFEVTAHAGSDHPFVSVHCEGMEIAGHDITPGHRHHRVHHESLELCIVTNFGSGYDYVQLLDGSDGEVAWYEAARGEWDLERVSV